MTSTGYDPRTSHGGRKAREGVPFADPAPGEVAALVLTGARVAVHAWFTDRNNRLVSRMVVALTSNGVAPWRASLVLEDDRDRARLIDYLEDVGIQCRDSWLLALLERVEAAGSTRPTQTDPALPVGPTFVRVNAQQMKDRPAPEFLIRDVLVQNTLAAAYGPPDSFKSFLSVDMALSVAAGQPWHGRRVAAGPTLYISGEGSAGLAQRIRAWELARGIDAPTSAEFICEAISFLDRQQVDALITDLEGLATPPVLIVIDTLARAMVGGDENSAKDMGLVIDAAERLRAATKACVLLVHHAGYSGTIRGSSSLPGGLHTTIKVTADGDLCVVACDKMKDADKFPTIQLIKRTVELGIGPWGDLITSLVFDLADRDSQDLTGRTLQVLAILVDFFGDLGATSTQWETACTDAGIGASTFWRCRKELVQAGRVRAEGPQRGARYFATTTEGDSLS